MKYESFNQILLKARDRKNVYEDAGLWLAVAKIARRIADKHIPAAGRGEREDATSLTCVKLIKLYRKQRKLGIDIFTDYSAEHLYRTVCKIAYCTAVDCYKAVCSRLRNETSLTSPIACDGDELTLGDTLPDTKTLALDETAVARSVIRKAIEAADISTLVSALDIKRSEFCNKGEHIISAEKFTQVIALHLSEVTDGKTLCGYCDKLLALGSVNVTKLYNKIYNDNRKREDDANNELILTLKPDTDDD